MLDERAYAGRENVDSDHARRYDSKMDASAGTEADLLEALGFSRSSTLIEFGSGTGQLAVEMARRGARVIAVDVSEAMLDVLRAKIVDLRLDNVEVVEAGFLSYACDPESIDFAYSRLALHHLPDLWKAHALQRVFVMLKPSGVFRLWDVVYNFEPHETTERIERWCSSGRDVAPGVAVDDGWGRWELAEHVRDEFSTYNWLLEVMVERVGFVIERCDKSDDMNAMYVLRKPA